VKTIADLLGRLGDIPPDRVRFDPVPGTATVADLLKAENHGCELVEGVLVEKPMGLEESFLAGWLLTLLNQFVLPRNLGIVTGEAGFMELPGGPVRGPDVAFISWDRMSARRRPTEPIPLLTPDLVVEVLSPSNTPGEMARKRTEYFGAGAQLVWRSIPGRGWSACSPQPTSRTI
jgi:Uma2 family endonuclease